ncbi:MAG: chitobiase/beta-hexosaminidase C-terminal domain-containing protein [Bacteroidaceae bacterium]|nr:chitobiase/beta-hexosaminidase C-terminal domain-containing protein [Bacteroidaceae bacterium]
MKKLLLSALALAMTMGVSAQRWDFTNWSDETVANLKAVNPTNTEWSDIEKAADSAPTDISKENCFWQVVASGSDGITLAANGVNIKETEGLIFTNTSARSLAIAVNYPETSLGAYNGPSYLWLGSKNQNYIVIPNVEPGTEIKIGLESHKPAEARGVELYVGRGNSGTKLLAPDGSTVATPTTYEDQVWLLPEELTDTPNEDGTYDVTIRNTNGCHLYYIQVGDDEGAVEEAKKIAYLHDSSNSDIENDPIFEVINGSGSYEVEAIDIKDFTSDMTDTISALETNYDLVVVTESPASGHKFASALKGMVNRVPMMNLKSFFYKSGVWGWGAGVNPTSTGIIMLTEAGANHKVFGSLGYGVGDEIELWIADGYEKNIIQGYSVAEGSLIAEDDVLATVGDGINAIHEHGSSNKYMLFPFSNDAALAYGAGTLAPGDDLPALVTAIVDYLADSKSKVRQAVKPTINQTYGDGVTTVEITTGIEGAVIYYTIDGSEPTTASPVYTKALTFTEPAVVKAYIAAPGYNDSEVSSAEILIKSQWAAPTITLERYADSTIVKLEGAAEGANIYFNFVGGTDAATSQAYTGPVKLIWPGTITAFVSGGDNVDSEIVSEYVSINSLTAETIRLDTIAHFDANPTDWFLNDTENGGSGEAKAYYFNGKSAWNYYGTEVDYTEPAKDEEGNLIPDSVITYYKPDPAAVKVFNPLNENGWVIKSAGQVLTLEGTLDTQIGVGNDAANRFAEEAIDAIEGAPSKSAITFGGKMSGEPYTATIETTGKYAAPFDVLVMAGNGDGGAINMNIEVSADGTTWTKIGDVNFAGTKRYWKRTRVAYNEPGEVYVRVAHVGGKTKAQVYDIVLFNNGEISKEYAPTAIDLPTVAGAEVVGVQIYNLSGVQQNGLGKGLNIVRRVYSNGAVEVLKVMGK